MEKLYGAYGSNVNMEDMLGRCPSARPVGTSLLQGYKLIFRGGPGSSYLTVEADENESVPLAIWRVSERDERFLDYYEGYPDFYTKEVFKLPVKDLKDDKMTEEEVFVYVMTPDYAPIAVPSDYYLQTCASGYDTFGFSTEPLRKALDLAKKEGGSY